MKQDNFIAALLENQGMVFRYAMTLTCCRADAEEVYQSTCMTLWEKWQQGVRPDHFGAWSRVVAKNHARNLLRKRDRQPVLIDEGLLDRIHLIREQESAVLDDRRAALAACLEKLPEKQRSMIDGYYRSRASVEEIADQTRRSVQAVYKAIQRVRAALFDCVTQRLSTDRA